MNYLVWQPDARADLQEIYSYVSEDSIVAADKLVDDIIARVERVVAHPSSGRHYPNLEGAHVREVFFGAYRIIYSVRDLPAISVLRVIHSARDFQFPA